MEQSTGLGLVTDYYDTCGAGWEQGEARTSGFRPILILNDDVSIIDGDGSRDFPFKLQK